MLQIRVRFEVPIPSVEVGKPADSRSIKVVVYSVTFGIGPLIILTRWTEMLEGILTSA